MIDEEPRKWYAVTHDNGGMREGIWPSPTARIWLMWEHERPTNIPIKLADVRPGDEARAMVTEMRHIDGKLGRPNFETAIAELEVKAGPGPFYCTKDRPWDDSVTGTIHHPAAKFDFMFHAWDGGSLDVYNCPHCGARIEVPTVDKP